MKYLMREVLVIWLVRRRNLCSVLILAVVFALSSCSGPQIITKRHHSSDRNLKSEKAVIINQYEINGVTYIHKKVQNFNGEPTDFIEAGPATNGKPYDVFVFVQGSSASPLISEDDNGKFLLLSFTVDQFIAENKFVIAGKPHIPVYSHYENLTDNFEISETSVLKKYFASNTVEIQAKGIDQIIKELRNDDKVKNIFLIGHSQGARIIAAVKEKYVQKRALLSVNLYGRFHEEVAKKRFESITDDRKINLEKTYNDYQSLKLKSFPESLNFADLSLQSYKSFTWPSTYNLIKKLRKPVLIAYGGHDVGVSFSNETARFELQDEKKENIRFRSYEGLDHNFKSVNAGNNNEFWQDVMEDTVKWLKE